MKKYKCSVCGYVYDPAQGDPDNGVAREQLLKIYQIHGVVQFVELPKICLSQRNNLGGYHEIH